MVYQVCGEAGISWHARPDLVNVRLAYIAYLGFERDDEILQLWCSDAIAISAMQGAQSCGTWEENEKWQ